MRVVALHRARHLFQPSIRSDPWRIVVGQIAPFFRLRLDIRAWWALVVVCHPHHCGRSVHGLSPGRDRLADEGKKEIKSARNSSRAGASGSADAKSRLLIRDAR